MHSCRRSPALVKSLPVRRFTTRAAAGMLAVLAAGCVSDPAAPAADGGARLAIAARVAAANADAIGVSMRYERRAGGSAPLFESVISLAGYTPGATLAAPLSVELGPCLADPDHLPGGDGCSVVTTLRLLRGSQVLDEHVLPAFVLTPGQTAQPASVVLSEVSGVRVTAPGGAARLFAGATLPLAATPVGMGGAPVAGRAVTWSSATPAVATVDAATGVVTGVAPGSAVIRATAAGRQGELTVAVVERPRLVLGGAEVTVTTGHGAPLPEERTVTVADEQGGALPGLAVGPVAYEGGQAGWLDATLSAGTTPATLRLRATRTDLPVGSYAAVVPVSATDALPQTVRVTYTVTAPVVLGASPDHLVFESTGEHPEAQTIAVTRPAGVTGPVEASVDYLSPATNWLAVHAMDAGPGTVTVQVQPHGGMAPGVHTADLVLAAPGTTQPTRVRVTYTVEYDFSGEQYGLEAYTENETDFVVVGDSLQLFVRLYDYGDYYEYGEIEGIPVTFDVSHPFAVNLRPTTTTTGGSVWIHPTGVIPDSMYVYVTARVPGQSSYPVRIAIYDQYSARRAPAPVARPQRPQLRAARPTPARPSSSTPVKP